MPDSPSKRPIYTKAGEMVDLTVLLRVDDELALRSHAESVSAMLIDSLEHAICEGVCNPEMHPLDSGFEVLSKVASLTSRLYTLRIQARVFDSVLVTQRARSCYSDCWCDSAWQPGDIREALYEILISSNANPPPEVFGITLGGLAAPEEIHARRHAYVPY